MKKNGFSTRRFKSGGYSVLVSLIVVLVVVAVNVFVGQLPSTLTKFDVTSQQLFTFSDQTRTLLSALTEPVTLTLVAENGSEDATTQELLNRYKALSSHVTVAAVDPVVSPKFTANYTDDNVDNNSVIVESALRSKVVAADEIYEYDYSNYYSTGSYEVSFAGEGALTSAIDYVTSADLPIVYELQGHGETALAGTLKTAVEKDNLTLQSLSLLAMEAVPEDADCLLINAPTADLSAEEAQKVIAYLERGGRLLLVTDYSDTAMPNLLSVTQNYGVTATDGVVVEGDLNHCLRGYAHYLLPDVQSHEITQPLVSGSKYVLMPLAHGITALASYRGSLTIASLLKTSGSAYNKADAYHASTLEKTDGDTDGPFDVGVAVSEAVDNGETRMVWFSTSQMLSDDVNQMVGGANQDLFLNSLGWMCERENSISIRAKSLSAEYLTVPSGEASLWSAILSVILPLGVLGAGVWVCLKRRKR